MKYIFIKVLDNLKVFVLFDQLIINQKYFLNEKT